MPGEAIFLRRHNPRPPSQVVVANASLRMGGGAHIDHDASAVAVHGNQRR